VQSDDTISSIALMFDISLDTIKQSNHLSGSTIKPGQSLIILPITGVLYTVVANDSLQKIAKKYSVNIDDILTYNDLPSESSKIAVGQQLIIPHGKPSASDITSYLARQKSKVPSFEPLLDPVWNWPSYPDYFACPVPRARLSQGLHGHNAVDLAISYGTPIHAAASGVVIISKSNGLWNGGYGNFVDDRASQWRRNALWPHGQIGCFDRRTSIARPDDRLYRLDRRIDRAPYSLRDPRRAESFRRSGARCY